MTERIPESTRPDTQSHLFYQAGTARPLVDHAKGIYIWDVRGRRYIDGSSGAMVCNVGHGNECVLSAMREQMQSTVFSYRLHFENEPAEELARELSHLMPPDLDRVFFCSGGSEAVESCLKMARQYAIATGRAERYKVISRYPSYHGSTLGALAVTGYTPLSSPFAPMMREMPKIPAPTCYRDRDALDMRARGLRYADMLEAQLIEQGPDTVLAFIMEPVGGASTGALVAPDSYYARIRQICDRYGVLLIHDEVMSGAGRSGRFLAGEHWPSARPDLIALSKGLASGYSPLGAMVVSREITDAVLAAGGFAHGYTYAGNPLACAAGRAVLHELTSRDLIGNASRVGAYLYEQLESLKSRFPFVGDVRGKGLLLAFEMVADRVTWATLPTELNAYQRVVDIAYERGLIVYSRRTRGGLSGDHILVCPPLIVTRQQIDEIMAILVETLAVFACEAGLDYSI